MTDSADNQVTADSQLDTQNTGSNESQVPQTSDPLEALAAMFDDNGNLLDDPKNLKEPESGEDKVPEEDKEVKEEEPASPKHKVKVDGEEYEVELSELIKGYQREADYTRKTMKLSEERNIVSKVKEEVAQIKTQAQQERELTSKAIQQVLTTATLLDPVLSLEQNTDWARLAQEDPGKYVALQADLNQRKSQLNVLDQYLQAFEQQKIQDQQAQFAERAKFEYAKLTEVMPEVRDPEKAEATRKELGSFLNSVGFSDQELANVIDHRMLLVAKKAMLYDKAMAQRNNKTTPPAQPLEKGGVATTDKDVKSESAQRQLNKFKSSGSLQDGAAALVALGLV